MWGGMEASYQELHEGATLEASPLAQSALHMTATATAAKSLQSSLTLCDSIDGSPPGSAVPGILQARTLEWVAMCLAQSLTQSMPFVTVSDPHARSQDLLNTRHLMNLSQE